MYGLAAIQQANGWAMAGAGAGIVLIGLAVLSFLISMLPRITDYFEEKTTSTLPTAENNPKPKMIVPDKIPDDLNAASTIYIALTDDLGKEFTLVDLYRKTKQLGLPHPHLSINRFRDAGILVSVGEERFSWQPIAE